MTELLGGSAAIIEALLSRDAWAISSALGSPAAYLLGTIVTLVGGYLLMLVFRAVPFLDRYFEKTVLVGIYLVIAGIIFVEVIRRFGFGVQAPWSTTLPPYLFLIMTWFGCAYNVRLRAHLRFTEIRSNLPPGGKLFCMSLDAVLWLTFSVIVIVTTLRQTANSASNFQILLGTDNTMQWWFYICVPLSWLVLSARVIENALEDFRRYRNGEELMQTGGIADSGN